MRKNRKYYRALFRRYPDMVTTMLGGVGDTFARKLIREGLVRSVFIKPHYFTSKDSVIDYVLSADYAARDLKVRI